MMFFRVSRLFHHFSISVFYDWKTCYKFPRFSCNVHINLHFMVLIMKIIFLSHVFFISMSCPVDPLLITSFPGAWEPCKH